MCEVLQIVCTVVADTRENWAPSGFKGLQEMIILQIAHKNAVTGVDLVGKKIQKYISERDQVRDAILSYALLKFVV